MTRSPKPGNPELLARCRDGDDRAWRELIERFGSLILSVPRRMGLSAALADDVFSDVCLALVRSLRTIREPERLAGWIVRTATRSTWKVLRSRGNSGAPLSEQTPASMPEPVELAADLEAEQLVRDSVARLQRRCRSLLEQLYFAVPAPSYDEIASASGLPRGSIGPTRARCLQNLRRYLEPLAERFAVTAEHEESEVHA